MKRQQKKLNELIGQTRYYICSGTTGGIEHGVIVRTTPKFCVLENDRGGLKRKSARLLFATEDEAKLDLVKRVNEFVSFNYELNILEASSLFREMMEKYPEKFV